MHEIMIIGYGYVGTAIGNVFKKDNVTVIDPKFNKNRIVDYKGKKFDIIFVCVDTPKDEKFKTLCNILRALDLYMLKDTIVCCKSTALPKFYESCEKRFKNIKVIYSPEYLSHWNNIEDFKNQKFIIVGGNKSAANKCINILISRLKHVKHTRITDIKTAALIKYSENTFLALKVTFANELYNIHKKLSCKSRFAEFTEMLGLDERIGKSHMQVPGRDKKFGWGGHCYDKDIYEFEKFSKSKLIKTLRKVNRKHRNKKH